MPLNAQKNPAEFSISYKIAFCFRIENDFFGSKTANFLSVFFHFDLPYNKSGSARSVNVNFGCNRMIVDPGTDVAYRLCTGIKDRNEENDTKRRRKYKKPVNERHGDASQKLQNPQGQGSNNLNLRTIPGNFPSSLPLTQSH